jgi:ferric-dicitrate binding protein FerR (iron transport regulator)
MHKKKLLNKYLAGESSRKEEKALFRLLRQGEIPNDPEVFQELWHKSGTPPLNQTRSKRMYQGVRRQTTFGRSRRKNRYRWSVAATVSALLLIASVLVYQTNSTTLTVGTTYGEQQTVSLPDGSIVIVNANSRLSYQQAWEEDEVREVWLEGEAYFKVSEQKANDDRPIKFIVHADDLDIQVLGTEFNVLNRAKAVQVVLAEGKIHLRSSKAQLSVDMQPGEMVEYNGATDGPVVRQKVNPRVLTSWKDEELIFQDEPLGAIADRLEATYGYQIIFEDEAIRQEKFTVSIPANEIELLFPMLTRAFSLEMKRTKNQIIFTRN